VRLNFKNKKKNKKIKKNKIMIENKFKI